MSIIQKYKNDIEEINNKIKDIQNACTHPRIACDKTYHESSDEYSTVEDRWYRYKCNLCEHVFIKEFGDGNGAKED